MSDWPQLTRAPLVEALVDLRIERVPEDRFAAIKAAADELAEQFPSRLDLKRGTFNFTMTPDAPANLSTSAPEPIGLVLRSADDRFVAQFRLDGFSLSRLQPYTTWDDLKAKSRELWQRYQEATRPTRISRVALRFVNRIPMPLGQSFEQTFTTTFSISTSLPQSVAGFLLRIILPFEAEQCLAIVSQALDADGQHCIFDLDVFSDPPEGFTEEEAWAKLEVLRKVKNRVFFESLTTQAVENFR